jgi:hypothetical protein
VDYEVVWTEPAAGDLETIVRYVAQDSATAAEALRAEFFWNTSSCWPACRTSGRTTKKTARDLLAKSSAASIASSTASMVRRVASKF